MVEPTCLAGRFSPAWGLCSRAALGVAGGGWEGRCGTQAGRDTIGQRLARRERHPLVPSHPPVPVPAPAPLFLDLAVPEKASAVLGPSIADLVSSRRDSFSRLRRRNRRRDHRPALPWCPVLRFRSHKGVVDIVGLKFVSGRMLMRPVAR